MSRFAELNTNVTYVADLLLVSDDLMKLLVHNNKNPLAQPVVTNPSSYLFKNIFPLPKIPEVEEEQKSIISYIFSNASLGSQNKKFKNYKLIFYVICHLNLWRINDGLRPYLISNEIDTIFNELRGTSLSIGKVLFGDWIYREFNKNFCGYYQVYDLENFS